MTVPAIRKMFDKPMQDTFLDTEALSRDGSKKSTKEPHRKHPARDSLLKAKSLATLNNGHLAPPPAHAPRALLEKSQSQGDLLKKKKESILERRLGSTTDNKLNLLKAPKSGAQSSPNLAKLEKKLGEHIETSPEKENANWESKIISQNDWKGYQRNGILGRDQM